MCANTLGGMQRRGIQALDSGAQGQDERHRAQTEMQEVPSEHQEALLTGADQALAKAVQRWCSLLPGDLQKLPGCGAGKAALGWPCWSRGLLQATSRGPS